MLQTPSHTTPKERAYAYIKNAIIIRELLPLDGIDLSAIAADIASNRVAVNEAAALLADQGWLMRHSNKKFCVKPVTAIEIAETTQVRMPLELLTVESIMPILGRRQFEYLEALLSQHERAEIAPDLAEEHLSLDQSFHLYLTSLTRNSRLMKTMRELRELNLRIGVDPERAKVRFTSCLNEHTAIVNALRRADCAAAKEAVATHIYNAQEALTASII